MTSTSSDIDSSDSLQAKPTSELSERNTSPEILTNLFVSDDNCQEDKNVMDVGEKKGRDEPNISLTQQTSCNKVDLKEIRPSVQGSSTSTYEPIASRLSPHICSDTQNVHHSNLPDLESVEHIEKSDTVNLATGDTNKLMHTKTMMIN